MSTRPDDAGPALRDQLQPDVAGLAASYDLDERWLRAAVADRQPSDLTVDDVRASLGMEAR